MSKPRNDPASKQRRKEEAAERKSQREQRTNQEQLDRLDQMFGEGQGARKERARLLSLIDREVNEQKLKAKFNTRQKNTKKNKGEK